MAIPTLRWEGAEFGRLLIIDQTRLPGETVVLPLARVEAVRAAIRRLAVRGAPAIGIAGAYGVVLALREADAEADPLGAVERAADLLAKARPTAVNLAWAVERVRDRARSVPGLDRRALAERLLAEARAIHDEDRAHCAAIGRHGARLLPDGARVLTHCNAGALATGGLGTALAVIYAAVAGGKRVQVYADETRPLLQGARLTAWELLERGVPVTVLPDVAAGGLLARGGVDCVVVGADRIAANGDTANKVGTYPLALSARAAGVPFYVAAPSTTFDLVIADGRGIPIEERGADEVTCPFGVRIAPEGAGVYNPAFDVTPADLIAAIITERGLIRPVHVDRVRAVLGVDRGSA